MEGLGSPRHILLLSLFFLLLYSSAAATEVKKAVVAGSFYPKEKKALEETLHKLMENAGEKHAKGTIIGIISPHAGYEYSGNVAAYGFRQIRNAPFRTVLLFGPSHHFPFKGASIISSGSYETPLGKVEIDRDTAKRIMESCKFVRDFPLAFEKEHSVEVQIPFLQKSLKDFKIVPVIMGDMRLEDHRVLANFLDDLYEKDPGRILSIFSTDMSHFHPYDRAKKLDSETIKLIERMDIKGLIDAVRSGKSELCGFHPVLLSLMLADIRNCEIKPLRYSTSAEASGGKESVVGYFSALILEPEERAELGSKEKRLLLSIARTTLNEYVKTKKRPVFDVKDKRLNEKEPVFVTLTRKGELRGCIGHTKPIYPLFQAVSEMTINASCCDPRFPPVSEEEIRDIEIEISVIGRFKRLMNLNELEIGKHGLYVVVNGQGGLLLPQVAERQKWSREEFLRQTCVKAGLEPNVYIRKDTKIYFFKAYSFSEGNFR